MINLDNFKPNLIPTSKVKKPIDIPAILKKLNRTISDYIISLKKDGCRLEIENAILTRAMKPVLSLWIQDRYAKLLEVCKANNIIFEGEFYAHGMSFPEICRFFKTSDVTKPSKIKELRSDEHKYNLRGTKKKPIWDKPENLAQENIWILKGFLSKFEQDWPGRSVEWMSTYHEDLKLWPFDVIFKDNLEMTYDKRIKWLFYNIYSNDGLLYEFRDILCMEGWFNIDEIADFDNLDDVDSFYEDILDKKWEGLVYAYKKRTYKFNRSTPIEADLFKRKDDKNEYDGQVLDIVEGTVAKKGAPKTTNELGRSVTSKLKDDREPSGIASGILSEYNGFEITVSFEGYSHEELRDILTNKDDYIGEWFVYTGMNPTKRVPRHAHMNKNGWRDPK